MNDYVGKICPYCKAAFTEDDEIVVCSVCDMPHHKDCWVENKGCTTFGCLGTIKSADGGPTSVTNTQLQNEEATAQSASISYCIKCGAPIPGGNAFCGKCGNPVNITATTPNTYSQPTVSTYAPAQSYQPVQQQNNYYGYSQNCGNYSGQGYSTYSSAADDERDQLIGTKTEYYVPKFNELKSQNKKTSWNWCAFLVAPYWFIYRKMYGYGAAALGLSSLFALIGNWFFLLLAFGGYVVLGIFGNYIYMQMIEKHTNISLTMREPEKTQYISENGGTNTTATWLTIVGYAVLITIIQAL